MDRLYATIAALALVLVAAPAQAGYYLEKLFGKESPCVIEKSDGGPMLEFIEAAHEVNAGACERVVVDGPCLSGCTVFLDRVDPARVCLTRFGRLGFHPRDQEAWLETFAISEVLQGKEVAWERYLYPQYSSRLSQWLIPQRRAYPHSWLVMFPADAARLWRLCK